MPPASYTFTQAMQSIGRWIQRGVFDGAVPTRKRRPGNAFTLIELLLVLFIIVVMIGLLMPALTNIGSASGLTKAAYDIQGTLDQARAYAMANNTYAYVGLVEEDVTQPASAKPQTPGIGRVAIAVVAARGGTRGYDATAANIASPAISGTNLIAIGKLQHFENTHLVDFGATPPTTGGMARPAIPDPQAGYPNYRLANSAAAANCVTPFGWPLGSTAQYTFKTVINFDPQGVARIQGATNADIIPPYMEIGLQQTHGKVVSSGSNSVAIQIDGMSGSTRIYRP